MTFNVWYGGVQVELDRIGAGDPRLGRRRGGRPGARGQPAPDRGGGRHVVRGRDAPRDLAPSDLRRRARRDPLRLRGGRRRARWSRSANVHLPSSPYGPELVRDGRTPAQVLGERARHAPRRDPARTSGPLARLAGAGVPTFLVGDFNSPSHLDWTPAAAARPREVPAALAGLGRARAGRASATRTARRTPTRWRARASPGRRARRRRGSGSARRSTGSTGSPRAAPPPTRGEPARGRAGRPGRGRGRAVGIGPPGGRLDVRRDARRRRRRWRTPSRASSSAATPVTIRYSGARGKAKRIGILPARGGRPLASLPIGDTSDHRAAFFGTAGLRPGAYRAAADAAKAGARLVALLGAAARLAPAHPRPRGASTRPGSRSGCAGAGCPATGSTGSGSSGAGRSSTSTATSASATSARCRAGACR